MEPHLAGVHHGDLTDAPSWRVVTQVHIDLAAALQHRTEEVMLHLAQIARIATGSDRLCVGGGVAMNCVAVGRFSRPACSARCSCHAPGDSGTALGAAVAVLADRGQPVPTGVQGACYLGPSPHDLSHGECQRGGLTGTLVASPAERAAAALADGQIIGLCAGPLEAGPRALGNRSCAPPARSRP